MELERKLASLLVAVREHLDPRLSDLLTRRVHLVAALLTIYWYLYNRYFVKYDLCWIIAIIRVHGTCFGFKYCFTKLISNVASFLCF